MFPGVSTAENIPRKKRPTIIDVAAAAGVSKSLVSLVLRGATTVSESKRQSVLSAAAHLGYRANAVARSLVQRHSHLIGVLLPDLHDVFLADTMEGVQEAADAHDYRIIISIAGRGAAAEQRALDTLLELRIDGLVVANAAVPISTIKSLNDELPVVLVGRHVGSRTVDRVSSDDSSGASLAVVHLAGLGHRRIAHIDGGSNAGALERRKGYERAMQTSGLGRFLQIVAGSSTHESGQRAVNSIFRGRRQPTAIFAAHDFAALGAMHALCRLGVAVPEQVSIVGFENVAYSACSATSLTTIEQSRREIGVMSVMLLLERLTGRRITARHAVLPARLIERSSTAPRVAQ